MNTVEASQASPENAPALSEKQASANVLQQQITQGQLQMQQQQRQSYEITLSWNDLGPELDRLPPDAHCAPPVW